MFNLKKNIYMLWSNRVIYILPLARPPGKIWITDLRFTSSTRFFLDFSRILPANCNVVGSVSADFKCYKRIRLFVMFRFTPLCTKKKNNNNTSTLVWTVWICPLTFTCGYVIFTKIWFLIIVEIRIFFFGLQWLFISPKCATERT